MNIFIYNLFTINVIVSVPSDTVYIPPPVSILAMRCLDTKISCPFRINPSLSSLIICSASQLCIWRPNSECLSNTLAFKFSSLSHFSKNSIVCCSLLSVVNYKFKINYTSNVCSLQPTIHSKFVQLCITIILWCFNSVLII